MDKGFIEGICIRQWNVNFSYITNDRIQLYKILYIDNKTVIIMSKLFFIQVKISNAIEKHC